jgi:hypothetical protein
VPVAVIVGLCREETRRRSRIEIFMTGLIPRQLLDVAAKEQLARMRDSCPSPARSNRRIASADFSI